MKQIFTIILITFSLNLYSQTFVSTIPENKNVILEQFTGIYCAFCPDGHVIAEGLAAANPNDVFISKIHTGGYANPNNPNDPNFSTIYGSAIRNASGLAGYPAGTVNRATFSGISPQGSPGTTALSRGDWQAAVTQILSQPSYVNLGAQASFDMSTGILTVNTETYYTSTTTNSNYLHVAVIENNIPGPQSGANNYNPGNIISGPWSPTYNHKDMFRHLMDGENGLQYSNTSSGTFVPNTHTWTMPINTAPGEFPTGYFPDLDPTNMDVIAFITDGTGEIITGIQADVICIFPNDYDVNVTAASSPDVLCATTNDISITFRNYGNLPLTSLDLNYDINGNFSGNQGLYNWTGNLASGAQTTVTVTNVSFTPQSDNFGNPGNTVNWIATSPNGQIDQNPSNNTITSSFSHQEFSGNVIQGISAGNISIDITTDGYPGETTWELVGEDGTVYGSGGPYSTTGPQPTVNVSVPGNICAEFILYDSYGDGMCCANGVGSVLVQDVNGTQIFIGDPVNLQNFSEISVAFSTGSSLGPAWECSPFGCVEGTPGLGQYMTESQCESDPTTGCYVGPTWNCDPLLGCFDVGTAGLGTYNTLSECINASNSCNNSALWSDDCSDPTTWIFTNTSSPPLDWNWTSNTNIQSQMVTPLQPSLQTFNSTTASNGFMIINSDAAPGNSDGNGTPIIAEFTNVTPIDLTGYPNVRLSFQHSFRWWQDTRGVRVSADNGLTWTDFEITNNNSYTTQFNSSQSSNNPQTTIIDISSIAGGQSQVLIQFYYNDHDYWAWYWTVDDIKIEMIPQNSLVAENYSYGGNNTLGSIQGHRGIDYTFFPLNQAVQNKYNFDAKVINDGLNTQSGVTLNTSVNHPSGLSIINNLNSNNINGGDTSLIFSSNNFTPTSTGVHEFLFNVSSNNVVTDTVIKKSIVTDSIYGIDLDFDYNGSNSTGYYTLYPGMGAGNIFEIFDNTFASSISFYVSNNTTVGTKVVISIFEMDPNNFSNNIYVGGNYAPYYAIQPQDIGSWVTIPITYNAPLQLYSGQTYIVTVENDYSSSGNLDLLTFDSGNNFNSVLNYPNWYTINNSFGIRLNVNNCNISNNITVINPSDSLTCDGTIIINSTSSQNISSYLIEDINGSVISTNNFATNVCSGVYYISVTDNIGCQALDTIVVGVVYGCMDSTALNFNPYAVVDDGSCTYPAFYGCTDSLAFNYDPLANTDDGSCLYCDLSNSMIVSQNTPGNCDGFIIANSSSSYGPISYLWNTGSTNNNILSLCDGIYTVIITDNVGCFIEDTVIIGTILGCTDPLALNYDPYANSDDGSCMYCDLSNSMIISQNTPGNCDGFAIANSFSSYGPISYLWSTGSTNNNITNLCSGTYTIIISDNVGCVIEDTVYIGIVTGCTDPNAINYNPNATVDDGSCIYCVYGCTDPTALNYDPNATCDDGSCTYSSNCTSPKPTGLYAYDVIDTRAKIGWDNMNDPNCMVWKYFVRYREVGTSQWTTKSAGVGNGLCNFGLNTVTKQLLNLTPSTTYEFRMKAFYCGGTSSNYSAPVQFTTADACPDMTNLSATTFNGNQAKVRFDWDTTGAYTFARILLRVDTAGSVWQTAGGFGIYYPQLFVNKFGLTPGQSYRAQGRTFCDSNITAYRSPTWTAPIFWTQPGSIRQGGGLSINNLDIYPNPSRDVFNITFNSKEQQDLRIRILSVVGAEVYSEDRESFVGEYTKQVSLDNYGKGIYFLEIETNNGIINKKLILQ